MEEELCVGVDEFTVAREQEGVVGRKKERKTLTSLKKRKCILKRIHRQRPLGRGEVTEVKLRGFPLFSPQSRVGAPLVSLALVGF